MERLLHRRDGLLEAEIDGELIGLDVARGTCLGFNATATRIWALLAEPTTLTALCEALEREFEVTPAARAEVAALVDELRDAGLIELVHSR